jgi:hypothetical protein
MIKLQLTSASDGHHRRGSTLSVPNDSRRVPDLVARGWKVIERTGGATPRPGTVQGPIDIAVATLRAALFGHAERVQALSPEDLASYRARVRSTFADPESSDSVALRWSLGWADLEDVAELPDEEGEAASQPVPAAPSSVDAPESLRKAADEPAPSVPGAGEPPQDGDELGGPSLEELEGDDLHGAGDPPPARNGSPIEALRAAVGDSSSTMAEIRQLASLAEVELPEGVTNVLAAKRAIREALAQPSHPSGDA